MANGLNSCSSDEFKKAAVGLWAFELDEGSEPRMYVDDTMLGLIGLTEQTTPELTYHAWYDNVDAAHYDEVAIAVNQMIEGHRAEVAYPWHYPDGRVIYVRCGGVRNFNYTKGIRIEGYHQDISDVLHYEKQEKQLQEFSEIASALAGWYDEVYYIDMQTGHFHTYKTKTENGSMNTHYDYSGDDVFAATKEAVPNNIHPDDAQIVLDFYSRENLERVLHGEKLISEYYRRKLNNEYLYHCTTAVNSALSKDHIVIGVTNVSASVAEEQIRKEELYNALQSAKSANAAKSAFLSSMSHDIRTPMNAILGYTTMARKHRTEAAVVDNYLQKIDLAGQTLLSLINQVLEMSRIESGKVMLAEDIANIRDHMDAMVTIMSASASQKNISLSYDINIRDENVITDAAHVNRIISNILGNAVKYTPEGGTIKYTAEQLDYDIPCWGLYRFTIRDTGIGMSEEYLDHIFEAFSRENTSTISHIQGTGLGMSIVKKMVDLFHGTISIQSEQGKGTEVVVTIPMKIQRDVVAKAVEQDTACFDLHGKKILLVEDNEMNREIAKDILEEFGVEVEDVEDGSIAVEIMQEVAQTEEQRFDLILMDVQMPIMDGYEATRQIRKLPGVCKTIPIIAMTANAFAEDRKLALDAGMDAHVPKPIDILTLSRTIAELIK